MTTLAMGRFKSADHYHNYWCAALAAEHTIEDVLKPEFWSHIAGSLKPGDLIRIQPEQNDFYAIVIVMAAQRGFAKVKIIDFVDLTKPTAIVSGSDSAVLTDADDTPPPGEEYIVAWKGPQHKHVVIRKSDNVRLKEGFSEKAAAEQWLRDHLAAMDR